MDMLHFTLDSGVTEDGDNVIRTGKVFEVGEYPDKQFSLSESEADAAVSDFTGAPMNIEHRPSFLDGKLGQIRKLWRVGKELMAEFAIPKWLHEVIGTEVVGVSAEWERLKKRLTGAAYVLRPRVRDAAMMAAFDSGVEVGQDGARQVLIAGMQQQLRNEYGAVIQYTHYAAQCRGKLAPDFAEHFTDEAESEAGHAAFLASKIAMFGVTPDTEHTPVPDAGHDLNRMLAQLLISEDAAVAAYTRLVAFAEMCGEHGLKVDLEAKLSDETAHRDFLKKTLSSSVASFSTRKDTPMTLKEQFLGLLGKLPDDLKAGEDTPASPPVAFADTPEYKTMQATIEALKAQNTALGEQIATFAAQRAQDEVVAFVDKAVADLKIAPAARASMIELGKANFTALKAMVDASPSLAQFNSAPVDTKASAAMSPERRAQLLASSALGNAVLKSEGGK